MNTAVHLTRVPNSKARLGKQTACVLTSFSAWVVHSLILEVSMPRPSQAWFRQQTGWWMYTFCGKERKLVQGKANRKVAEKRFHRLMSLDEDSFTCAFPGAAPEMSRKLRSFGIHRRRPLPT